MPSKSRTGRGRKSYRNALSLGSLAFVVSLVFSGPAQSTLETVNVVSGLVMLGTIIGVAVLSDILAIAATAAQETPFHAMASDRIHGAKEAVAIVRHGDRVNSICADVVGDICGTVSGAIGAAIIIDLRQTVPALPTSVVSMAVLGLIAAWTVGGKAWTKGFAVRNANSIVGLVGKTWYWIKKVTGLPKILKRLST